MNFFNVSQIRITAYSVEYSKVNRNIITSFIYNNNPFFLNIILFFLSSSILLIFSHLRFWVSESKEKQTKTTGATLQRRPSLKSVCVCALCFDWWTAANGPKKEGKKWNQSLKRALKTILSRNCSTLDPADSLELLLWTSEASCGDKALIFIQL